MDSGGVDSHENISVISQTSNNLSWTHACLARWLVHKKTSMNRCLKDLYLIFRNINSDIPYYIQKLHWADSVLTPKLYKIIVFIGRKKKKIVFNMLPTQIFRLSSFTGGFILFSISILILYYSKSQNLRFIILTLCGRGFPVSYWEKLKPFLFPCSLGMWEVICHLTTFYILEISLVFPLISCSYIPQLFPWGTFLWTCNCSCCSLLVSYLSKSVKRREICKQINPFS